jgi:transcription initiation factor TFIID subunit 2
MPNVSAFSGCIHVQLLIQFFGSYFDEIKHPMDFGTMQSKLVESRYSTMEQFAADAKLVFANCRQFNPPTTYPVQCADACEKVFDREWAKAMEKRLAYTEKRSLQSVMNKLVADPL